MHEEKADDRTDQNCRRICAEDTDTKKRHGALEDSQLDKVAYSCNNQVLRGLAAPSRGAIPKGPNFRQSEVRSQSYEERQRETDSGVKEMHQNPQ